MLNHRRALFAAVLVALAFVVVFATVRLGTIPRIGGPSGAPNAPLETDPRMPGSGVALTGAPGPGGSTGGPPAADLPEDTTPAGLLVTAARAGDAHCVRELLAAGVPADSQSRGYFPIHRAAASGSVPVLRLLIAAGAHLEALDQFGNSALTRAAFFGNPEAVVFLLRAGADPNAYAEPNNQTPLAAILSGWTMSLSRLRSHRLEPREEERFEAAQALIEAGADPHFGPHGHPPPVVLARGLGGAIGRLYDSVPEPTARLR